MTYAVGSHFLKVMNENKSVTIVFGQSKLLDWKGGGS